MDETLNTTSLSYIAWCIYIYIFCVSVCVWMYLWVIAYFLSVHLEAFRDRK